jgi:hypothetical protein
MNAEAEQLRPQTNVSPCTENNMQQDVKNSFQNLYVAMTKTYKFPRV